MSKTLADEFAEDFGSGSEEEEPEVQIKQEEENDEMNGIEAEDPSAMEIEAPTVSEMRNIAKLAHGNRLKSIVEVRLIRDLIE